MPTNLIQTPGDEHAWHAAKQAVISSTGTPEAKFTPHHWAATTSIFEKMKNKFNRPNPVAATRGPIAAKDATI